jgi:hypothetical protein
MERTMVEANQEQADGKEVGGVKGSKQQKR